MVVHTTNHIDTIVFEPDPSLIGKAIRVGDAAMKYNIGQRTLSGWAEKGIVTIIEKGPKVLSLEESSVARASAIFLEACKHTNKFRAGWILRQAVS